MIIDKVICICNICENSWFFRKKPPVKCPACSSPNWNKKDVRRYKKKSSITVLKKGLVINDGKKKRYIVGS